jgi:hypothetical protein
VQWFGVCAVRHCVRGRRGGVSRRRRCARGDRGLGYLLFNEFLVNRFGELTWHGVAEVWPVVVLLAVTARVGVAARRLQAVLAREAFVFGPDGAEAPVYARESHRG